MPESKSIPENKGLFRILSGLSWTYIIILLFWAIHLQDPHLLSIRKYETLLVLTLCAMLIFLRKYNGLWRTAGICMLSLISIITLGKELIYHYRKATVLGHNLDIERKLGAHFIVGFDKIDVLQPLVSKGLVGGVFITQRNVAQKSAEQLQQEIAELQHLRRVAGLAKLIIATDQEGGIVSRLSPPLKGVRRLLLNWWVRLVTRLTCWFMLKIMEANRVKSWHNSGLRSISVLW